MYFGTIVVSHSRRKTYIVFTVVITMTWVTVNVVSICMFRKLIWVQAQGSERCEGETGSLCTLIHALLSEPLSDALTASACTFIFLREERQPQIHKHCELIAALYVILGTPQTGANRILVLAPKYNKVVVVLFSSCLHAECTRGICGGADYPEQFVLSSSLFHFSAMCCKNQKVPFLLQKAMKPTSRGGANETRDRGYFRDYKVRPGLEILT